MKYQIKAGDTLSAIAQRFLGDGNLWPVIYRQNLAAIKERQDALVNFPHMRGPDWIFPGTTLCIDCRTI